MRADLQIISEWIAPDARVLDLGCGDGTLLRHLADTRNVTGYGLEINPKRIVECVRAGVNVIHTDLNEGLVDFDADSFDYVVMSQALQAVERPDVLIDEILRVGREGIVTFPNFGHWRTRFTLGLQGVMPLTPTLPKQWYNTDNIHLCTLRDFEAMCDDKGVEILQRAIVNKDHQSTFGSRTLPNLLGEIALYRFRRK